ncbi:DUF4255 domain-containing protein [Pontibacter pamirensis]|uniref:DUF4255 domain-containing protein n=1 Tax=Pontibacter pamirensis TaxID=2562824 RepID=UPI0013897C25|nr:DUF4255 domain-containing protein [Pontibacter pamirensis]
MIDKALNLIITQLNLYIPEDPPEVVLGNIALNEAADQDALHEKIVLTLVNIEEEATLKNNRYYHPLPTTTQYLHSPVFLNLYLLFSANYLKSYDKALTRLSAVIRFFQSRKTFEIGNGTSLPPTPAPDELELSLTMDLYTMSFEQINHLWGTLGGKQMPFVMYKGRLVMLQDQKIFRETPLIEEIQNSLQSTL